MNSPKPNLWPSPWPNRFSLPRRGLLTPPAELPEDRWKPSAAAMEQAARSPAGKSDERREGEVRCAFPGCAGGWATRWKRRTRPVFAGEWACSRACLEALVAEALRREGPVSSRAEHAEPYRHRVPLGLVLLAQGLITDPQLREALEAQRDAGHGRIGDWLMKACGVPEAKIVRGLGMQWGCPVLDVTRADPAAMALAMPAPLRAECGMLPVRSAGGRLLYVAFREAVNPAAAFALETMSGIRVESGLVSGSEFAGLERGLAGCAGVPCEEEHLSSPGELVQAVVRQLQRMQPVQSRLVSVHGVYWLRLWLERDAFAGAAAMLPPRGEDVRDTLYRLGTRHES